MKCALLFPCPVAPRTPHQLFLQYLPPTELQNVPPQVVRVDNVESQRPVKNTGLFFQHDLLLLYDGVIIGLVPGAPRLSRV